MTAQQVKELVQARLNKMEDMLGAIKVVGSDPILRDGQWQVLIEPTRTEPTPLSRYYELLSEVEEQLSDEEGLSVFLVPAPEGTYQYQVDDAAIEVKRREESLYVAPKGSRHMFAVYDLNGRHEFSNVTGGANVADAQKFGGILNDWRSRFDKAVHQYLDERKQAA